MRTPAVAGRDVQTPRWSLFCALLSGVRGKFFRDTWNSSIRSVSTSLSGEPSLFSELWVSCWTIYRMVLQLVVSSSSSSLDCEQPEGWQCGLLISRCSELVPGKLKVKAIVSQSCLTLWDAMECSLPGSSVHGNSPGKNTGVDCHAFLQEIFPTQGSNPGIPHCRQILYHLSHQGSLSLLTASTIQETWV